MQTSSDLMTQPQLTLVERTLLRQANQRASERCGVAELELKAHLAELNILARDDKIATAELPTDLLAGLRVAVEDYTSNARALYPCAEELLVSLKQTVSESVTPDDASSRQLVEAMIGWAIEAYFAR